MRRVTLSVQLALILAAAMVTSILAAITVDWIVTVNDEAKHDKGEADKTALQLLELRAKLSDAEFETARFLAARPDNWITYGAWDGLHPWDEPQPEIAAQIGQTAQVGRAPVDELIVASRDFTFYPPPRNRPRGPERAAPRALTLGDRPRIFTRDMPQDGEPRAWVLQPQLDAAGEAVVPVRLGPDGDPLKPRQDEVTVYTVAMLPQGSSDWIVVQKFMRSPDVGGTVSIAIYALVAGAVVALGALLLGRRVMVPFHRVARHAELLGRGERAPEVPVEGPKDVREILAAFNGMNARVSQATDYQIGLLRSLGHDLKGPLASVKRLAGTVRPDETRAQIETRLDSVQSIVEAIMSFSRAVMRDGDLEVTDMAAMLNTVVDEQADLGADAQAETPDRLLLTCRTNAMERCLRNLVENAVKYGGSVRARLFVQGEEAVIQIDDSGPGIPESEIENVFQPFFRIADDSQGSGLGLAIARTIAIDQGGTLTLSNRTESPGGLRAELRLPYARAIG